MAEEAQSSSGGRTREQNRTIWVVMLVMLVLLVGGGALAGTSSSSSMVNQGMRAVVVPTADAARTVVVVPCGTGAPISSGGSANVANVTGTTAVALPQGFGTRLVLVPRCAAGNKATSGTSLLPSAAFVPKPGTPIPPVGGSHSAASGSSGPVVGDPMAATSQLTVTPGSAVRTVIVSPCTGSKTGPAQTLLVGASGTPGTAVAPAC